LVEKKKGGRKLQISLCFHSMLDIKQGGKQIKTKKEKKNMLGAQGNTEKKRRVEKEAG
jgi:hypothetical protein